MCDRTFFNISYSEMSEYEKTLYNAIEKSPALKIAFELQDAFVIARTAVLKSPIDSFDEVLVYKACQYAVQQYCIEMSKKLNANSELIKALEEDDGLDWGGVVYLLIDKIPALDEFIGKCWPIVDGNGPERVKRDG